MNADNNQKHLNSAVNGQEPQTYTILKSCGSKSNYHTIAFIVPLGYLLILIKQLYIVINSGSISLKSICFRASKDPKQSTTSACNPRTNKQSFNLSDYIYSDWYVLVYSQVQWTATIVPKTSGTTKGSNRRLLKVSGESFIYGYNHKSLFLNRSRKINMSWNIHWNISLYIEIVSTVDIRLVVYSE